jgi:hypothetical protein
MGGPFRAWFGCVAGRQGFGRICDNAISHKKSLVVFLLRILGYKKKYVNLHAFGEGGSSDWFF